MDIQSIRWVEDTGLVDEALVDEAPYVRPHNFYDRVYYIKYILFVKTFLVKNRKLYLNIYLN